MWRVEPLRAAREVAEPQPMLFQSLAVVFIEFSFYDEIDHVGVVAQIAQGSLLHAPEPAGVGLCVFDRRALFGHCLEDVNDDLFPIQV